jgi:RNA polymerase-binding transcription factor DksA
MAKSKPKKPLAKKPAPKAKAKPVAKKPVLRKPAPKPKAAAKPAAKKPAPKAKAPAPKVAPGKPAAKPAPAAKGKSPTPPKGKPAPAPAPTKAKAGKPAPAPVPAKGGKPAKGAKVAPAISHDEQRKLLDSHRQGHHQVSPIEAAPAKPKLQVFTVDDVREYLKGRGKSKLNLWVPDEERKTRERVTGSGKGDRGKPHAVAPASVASLLGFNPFRKSAPVAETRRIPDKWSRYHKLLLANRAKLEDVLARHTEEALKKSGKDDAGDLSGYSQHMADAGTDTADRDFALNLISSEQAQIKEIDDAIERMRSGTYGVCEITGRPIPPSRLASVPHTRYSIEGQKELERQRRALRRRGGNPLGPDGDEVGFGTGGGGSGDGDGDDA